MSTIYLTIQTKQLREGSAFDGQPLHSSALAFARLM